MSNMKFLVIPVEDLKQFDVDWEYRRRNVEGTHALIHTNLYDKYFPPVVVIDDENSEPQEITYPYPTYEGESLDNMLSTPEWNAEQVIVEEVPEFNDNE